MKKLHDSERICLASQAISVFYSSGYVNLIQNDEGQRRHPDRGEVMKFLNGIYMAQISISRLNKELKPYGCKVDKKRHYIHGYVKVSVFKKITFQIITGTKYPT